MVMYTEEQVEVFIKATLTESVNGMLEWIRKETDIVDIDTRKVLENTEITTKTGAQKPIDHYIMPNLIKHGITFIK